MRAYGPNRIVRPEGPSPWQLLWAQFRSVVVALLIGASALSLLLGDIADAVAIGVVVAVNAGIGFIIEVRARRAMDSLRDLQGARAVVVRGGSLRSIDAAGLVPGDVIELNAGAGVPADARLLSETDLRTVEAALTGESFPVGKAAADLSLETDLADRANMVYQGTTVAAGTARALVVATGAATEVGRVAALTRDVSPEMTPLERRLDALGRRLAWLALGAAGLVTVLGAAHGEPWLLTLETGIALAVAAVPEGLPAVVTIALAIGLHRMARRRALVRRLPAVEALGAATVICTDKTRTLTSGDMQAVRVWTLGHTFEASRDGALPVDPRISRALEIAARASRAPAADQQHGGGSFDPVDAAMLEAARRAAIMADSDAVPVALIPFSSDRRFMASFHEREGGLVAFVKGAPQRVLDMCRPATTVGAAAMNEAMAAGGLRVIALASGPIEQASERSLHDLEFVGLVGLMDPPAAGVHEAIRRLQRAGLRTMVLTGDQQATAAAVARDLGLLGPGQTTIDGHELRTLDGQALAARLRNTAIFSRITPEDKLTIVAALQGQGEIVAMIGDGINDAPALRKADIGVAMGRRGTDVAQDAAAVVLQDDRFETIVAAVEEGRVIFDNIGKVVFYLFSCNLAEVLVLVIAGLFWLPLPLLPLQILWMNLVTDTLPALALALEPGEPDVMTRPPRDPQLAILSWSFVSRVFGYGAAIAASTLGAYVWGLAHYPAGAITMAFMTLTLAQVLHLGNARSRRDVLSAAAATSNPYALAALALSLLLQAGTTMVAPLAAALRVVPLTATAWLVVLLCSSATALVGQARHAWRPS